MSSLLEMHTRGTTKPSFAQSQQALSELPVLFSTLSAQLADVQKIIRRHAKQSVDPTPVLQETQAWVERTYDVVGDLLVEQRITNQLLAELVGLQRQIINPEDSSLHRVPMAEARHRALGGR